MTRYWKVLDENGKSCHGGDFQYDLPRWDDRKGWIPGAWTPLIETVVPCQSGYHVCKDEHLLAWPGPRIYACEIRGTVVDHGNKIVAGQVRLTCPTPWDDVAARLFAVECASEVLSLYEARYPNDDRPSEALRITLLYALGEATDEEWAAARDAAWDAAWAAARAAAWDAAWAAARAATWAAAWDAARAVARAATWAAACGAQTERLLWWLGTQ